MADKVTGSYLYELKPYVDKKKWLDATGDINSAIKSKSLTYDEWAGKKQQYAGQIKEIAKLKGEIESLEKMQEKLKNSTDEASKAQLSRIQNILAGKDGKGGLYADLSTKMDSAASDKVLMDAQQGSVKGVAGAKMAGFASSIAGATGKVIAFYEAMKKAITGAIELVDKQTELSNKLNAMGAFGNMGTRDFMARYGVSSTKANAMQNAMNLMGISESDLGRLNEAQREAYDELVDYYQQKMNSIDNTKLEEYYETLEEFQMAHAKWKMDLQTTFLKYLAESESFKKLTGSIGKFFEKSIQFLENETVQWFLDTFIEFLSALVDFGSWFLGLFSGGGGSTTNNTSNSSTNTFYIYGSDYSSNSDLARSIALKQQGGSIG